MFSYIEGLLLVGIYKKLTFSPSLGVLHPALGTMVPGEGVVKRLVCRKNEAFQPAI
jgi:hypothetical protein